MLSFMGCYYIQLLLFQVRNVIDICYQNNWHFIFHRFIPWFRPLSGYLRARTYLLYCGEQKWPRAGNYCLAFVFSKPDRGLSYPWRTRIFSWRIPDKGKFKLYFPVCLYCRRSNHRCNRDFDHCRAGSKAQPFLRSSVRMGQPKVFQYPANHPWHNFRAASLRSIIGRIVLYRTDIV